MRVLFVTSEIATLYKRGGLADVSYALPVAMAKLGIEVSLAMPYYEKVKLSKIECIGQLAIDFDRRRELVFIFRSYLAGGNVPVYLFRHPLLHEYDDNQMVDRFAFFSKSVAQLYLYAREKLGGPYDIIHCNDWHTALIPLLLGEHRKVGYRERDTMQSSAVKTILTIHNLLYLGETGVSLTLKLGFPKSIFHAFTTPLGRAIRLLQEGMECADRVTTVSPTYAREIMKGLHGGRITEIFTRRKDKILGILNGMDTDLWRPGYSVSAAVKKKAEIKSVLQRDLRLAETPLPLFGFIGRLEPRQKGLDLILGAVKHLTPTTYQLVILGAGEPKMVKQFTRLAQKYPYIAFIHTFDERLARRIYAGCDFLLVPSKFEPCGLTQMIAMRYGTPPLVRQTGGLADTVKDKKTGFVFGPYLSKALTVKMEEAIVFYNRNHAEWQRMVERVMRQNFSWEKQARKYLALYREVLIKS